MPKLFKITEVHLPDQPILKLENSFNIEEMLNSEINNCECTHKLYLTKDASLQIFKHIGWGKSTEYNSVEQGGILLGYTYYDEKQKLLYGVVEIAIPALTAKGSSTYLKFDHNTWKAMINKVDNIILNIEKNRQLYIIGWYHTHPGRLSVFMSSTDRNTQKRMFSQDWQYAIVLNPQNKIWKVFNGSKTIECRGFILQRKKEN
jgi:proteasome lid subunit RPN8/RPN11